MADGLAKDRFATEGTGSTRGNFTHANQEPFCPRLSGVTLEGCFVRDVAGLADELEQVGLKKSHGQMGRSSHQTMA